ncbi:hypothetical protein KGQ20_31035 [Catenulispora sp. NF23]|uniref:hypothetical protein n=1 Tax=Catenulispora pinistramenti TaxID=2705254 RepID=UPI001BA68210|nr:hypothetical protein [Catenulispora pinistramenti]MBS2537201.1 hypothetical protein [Catenulispora pinistramenti]
MSDEGQQEALRSHFATRAEEIQPSAELARRVAAIRPPARGRRLPLRMSALALGGVAVGAVATAVVVLAGHPGPAPEYPGPLAPPKATTSVIAPGPSSTPGTTDGDGHHDASASASASSPAGQAMGQSTGQSAGQSTGPTPSGSLTGPPQTPSSAAHSVPTAPSAH